LEHRLNATNVPAAQVRDLGQATQESMANGTLQAWSVDGDIPMQLPGLGFRAQTLFAGQSQPARPKPT
jgi:hypothetical protein